MTTRTRLPLSPAIAAGLRWPLALGVTTLAGTLLSACAMPFVGLAVLAAVTLRSQQAVATVALIWLANQIIGFTLLGFPHTAFTFGWGLVLGLSSLVALGVGQRMTANRPHTPLRLGLTFACAFVAYELGLFAFANTLGLACPFSLSVIGQVALNDAVWFIGLYAVHLMARRAAPHWFLAGPKAAVA